MTQRLTGLDWEFTEKIIFSHDTGCVRNGAVQTYLWKRIATGAGEEIVEKALELQTSLGSSVGSQRVASRVPGLRLG
jgi:hypothetical protein